MTDTTLEAQQEIFKQPLEGAELQAVNDLVNQHKANAALTQQLALDASRLITTSQERLAKQSGSGFFKRFASKISGKNSENQLQSQVDMLQMQRFAWHYLKQLQQQNLINAQSIAVIRNNLGTMNDYIIETRNFLEQAVDKINHRLEHVEKNTSFNSWSLHIEANKRRFKSIPGNLLVLHLTYDFMRSHRDVLLTSRDINYLVVTLEKLDVNCDQDVQLLDFIIELIDQIEIAGIERYREMIELAFDDHVLNSHFIQGNISGIGFNALYFLSENYEKVLSLTEKSEFCKSDEDREKIVSKFFGNEFSGLSTNYSIRDLIGEVIGGSSLAIDIYKDMNGLNVIPEEIDDIQPAETVSLLSSLPNIQVHTYLDNADSDEARRNYLLLFALCIENSTALNTLGKEFLSLLCEKAGYLDLSGEIANLADNQSKTQDFLPIMVALLNDDDKVYTWLIDAFFLLTLCQKKIESVQVQQILGDLRPAQFKDKLPHLVALINEGDEALVLEASANLAKTTRGWKNIIRYRELRFDRSFSQLRDELETAYFSALSLDSDVVSLRSQNYSVYIGGSEDDNLLKRAATALQFSYISLGRKKCLSSLNDMRKKAIEITNSGALHRANHLLTKWKTPTIHFDKRISYQDFELDNSVTNDDWFNQYSLFERQVRDSLNEFSGACSEARAQLGFFMAGEFDKSVVEIAHQKHEAWLLQRQQEKLATQSITITKDNHEHSFAIEWQDVKDPPCDPEQIRHIKTDGSLWLIVDDDGSLFRSEDRVSWQCVRPDPSKERLYVRKLDIVNGVWILFVGFDEGVYYSSDALTWKKTFFPELPSSSFSKTEDIVYLNGQWLWRFTERCEFSYLDKGTFFDTTATSTYEKAAVYCTDSLDAKWRSWEDTPSLPEGVTVESMRSLPGLKVLLIFCKYDSFYRLMGKNNGAEPFVKYYILGKKWRTCTWNSKVENCTEPVVTQMGNELMCFYSDSFMSSDKGYDWKRHPDDLYIGDCFHLENVSLFPSRFDSQIIYLSRDAKAFKEFKLQEGRWKHFCASNQGALSVYSPNVHETFLRVGKVIFEPAA